MVTLTNPINKQNIVDRFNDYVRATANTGIVWGTGANPFPEWDKPELWGGSTSGKVSEISGANLNTTQVTADTIYNVLIAETRRYGRIRVITAQLFVTGTGRTVSTGNATGTRPTPGTVFDETKVSHLTSAYDQTGDVNRGTVVKDAKIFASELEALFGRMRDGYNILRANSAGTFVTSVCHASCHSNCHGSRGRR